jgi:capsular exopolysaccharide synthesis family protein
LEFRDYLRLLHRNWVIITATMLVTLLAAAGVTLMLKPSYTAQTQLFVAIQSTGSVVELQQGNTFTQARVQSYVDTAKTPVVLQPVIDSLGLDSTAAELAGKISASADLNTVLITVSATDPSPAQAAAIAQSVAESLILAVGDLESPDSGEPSPIKISVVTPAVAPTTPSSPNTKLNLVLGLFLGLGAGIGISLLRTVLDTKVRGDADLSRVTDAPVLGGIAFDSDAAKKPLLTQAGHQSPRAESFRQIRTNLQFANVNSQSKSMLVTSSLPSEGKSTTATNMAIAMAQAGQRVVLIDADLRRPTVSGYLGLEGSAGLTTVLVGAADLESLLQPWGEDQLYVLTSGQIPPNPSELLGSDAMTHLINELELRFDAVIIDVPPLIPVTDASVLAQKVGGVVLVVGATKTRTQDLEKSLSSLKLVGANVLGVVLNLLPTKGPDAYSYYSYDTKVDSRQKRSSPHSVNGSHMRVGRRSRVSDNKLDQIVAES